MIFSVLRIQRTRGFLCLYIKEKGFIITCFIYQTTLYILEDSVQNEMYIVIYYPVDYYHCIYNECSNIEM
jgi:hypothetical protein